MKSWTSVGSITHTRSPSKRTGRSWSAATGPPPRFHAARRLEWLARYDLRRRWQRTGHIQAQTSPREWCSSRTEDRAGRTSNYSAGETSRGQAEHQWLDRQQLPRRWPADSRLGASVEEGTAVGCNRREIVVTGTLNPHTSGDFIVARLTSSGVEDPTFDGDGRRTFTTALTSRARRRHTTERQDRGRRPGSRRHAGLALEHRRLSRPSFLGDGAESIPSPEAAPPRVAIRRTAGSWSRLDQRSQLL